MKSTKKLNLFLLFALSGFLLTASAENDKLWLPSDTTSHRANKVCGINSNEKSNVVEIEGPGLIKHIWITMKCAVPQIQGLTIMRIYWDDEKEPSVEVPVGDFFGVGFGKEKKFKSSMIEMIPAGGESHSSLNSYWEMPFRKNFRIEIENKSARIISMFFIQVDYEKSQSLPDEALYFHAQFRRENPVKLHIPYTILEAEGKGNYVGTILNYHLLGEGAWVEGGQDFSIDGERVPSLPGTGGEDYFGHAWGFRTEENGFYHGTSYGPENNKMTAYRFHTPDPVHFKKSIKATMKCHGWDVQDREDDYSSVALWYQNEPHKKFPLLPEIDYDYLEVENIFRLEAKELIKKAKEKLSFKGKNLSLSIKNFTASGAMDKTYSGDKAFDGDVNTKWCELENKSGHWLAIDLGKECEIEGFILLNQSSSGDSEGFDTLAYKISAAKIIDGEWSEICALDKSNEKSPKQQYPFMDIIKSEKKIKTQFIRIDIIKSCELDEIARIPEFEIWGK